MMESVHEDCGDCLSPDFISHRPVAAHNNWSIAEQPIEQVNNASMESLNRGEDIDKMIESYTQRINVLNVEILELRMALKHEQHTMTVIREMNEKSDQELAKLIQQEREKNDQISHDYQLLLEDYNFLLGEYEEVNVRKENELKTLLESMSDVKVKYAEVEEENEKLLSELVQCKVDFANVSMSVDDLNAEKNDLQRLVDSYKAMIAKGELVHKPTNSTPAQEQHVDILPPAPSMFATPIQPVVTYISNSNSSSNNSMTKVKLSTDSDPMPDVIIQGLDYQELADSPTCEEIVFV